MSSRSGTEMPGGFEKVLCGEQSRSVRGQPIREGELQEPCVGHPISLENPNIPSFDAAGSDEYSF